MPGARRSMRTAIARCGRPSGVMASPDASSTPKWSGRQALRLTSAAEAATVVGVTKTEIKIGHTIPYSGNASSYGVIGKSHAAYFKMINDQGGINGRKIELLVEDAEGKPDVGLAKARKLVADDFMVQMQSVYGLSATTI